MKRKPWELWTGKRVWENGREYIATSDAQWRLRLDTWKAWLGHDPLPPMPMPERHIMFGGRI